MAVKRWSGASWEVYADGAAPADSHSATHEGAGSDPLVGRSTFTEVTSNYTLGLPDEGAYRCLSVSSSSAVTVTIPALSSVAFPIGARVNILQAGTGVVTVAAAAGVSLYAPRGASTPERGGVITLLNTAANTWALNGNDIGVVVPDLSGLTTTQADALITSTGLTKGTATQSYTSTSSQNNLVFSQTIGAGNTVPTGTSIGYSYRTFLATPVQPTISYSAYMGKFKIDNYNASYVYTLTNGATRSGNIVTLASATSETVISAQAFSGGAASPTKYFANKIGSYTPDTRYSYPCGQTCDTCQYCGCGDCGQYGGGSQSWGQCGCPGTMCWYGSYSCNCRDNTCSGGSAPALIDEPGYTWTGSEWYKIV